MRVCRFRHQGRESLGYYFDDWILPVNVAAERCPDAQGLSAAASLLELLPPDGSLTTVAQRAADWLSANLAAMRSSGLTTKSVELPVPIPRPNKLFLLAGNYNEHIQEGGGAATERPETFPYVFMKPPSTTLTNPGSPVVIPAVSPHAVDWELELAVVIGKRCKGIREREALQYVAGYTVINDISDRKFRPNPGRKKRDRDSFFDWLHGKWHDSFCPCGPCVVSAGSLLDPQALSMQLCRNGVVMQKATTAQQIFPVAAVIEFIASFVTLEPGDLISTGTPAGVGSTTGTFLQSGDLMEATIEAIGSLVTPVRGP